MLKQLYQRWLAWRNPAGTPVLQERRVLGRSGTGTVVGSAYRKPNGNVLLVINKERDKQSP